MNKSITTQNLINCFPPWSKVRTDDQSVGYQFLNTLAQPIEKLDRQLDKMNKNAFLVTANLDEIDIVHKIELPPTFNFDLDLSDVTNPVSLPPVVTGLVNSDYIPIALAQRNDIESFWYESVPNRASIAQTIVSIDHVLLNLLGSTIIWEGAVDHHLAPITNGGRIWVECANGHRYIRNNKELNIIERGTVTIFGITRKGTQESETFAFGWDDKQLSIKQWKRLTKVIISDMEDDVVIQIRSGDFDEGPYWSFWNARFSEEKTKIDEFWGLNKGEQYSLERIGFVSNDWQQLVQGFSEKEVKEAWNLRINDEDVYPEDIAIQPFTNRLWAITAEGLLLCYDLEESNIEHIEALLEKTPGSDVQLYVENKHLTFGENIIFQAKHLRITQEIVSYKLWYITPAGVRHNITILPNNNIKIDRNLSEEIVIEGKEYGEWIIGLEATMADETVFQDRVIVSVQAKTPITVIDLGPLFNLSTDESFNGIDFDSDQRLWVRTGDSNSNSCTQINLHTDIMLIDYDNKIIYLKENYNDVRITV